MDQPIWEEPTFEVLSMTQVLDEADIEVAFTNSSSSIGNDLF